MKFVLAPDSFKESMTAKQACEAMEKGIRDVFPDAECVHVPMADGGEGTVESLVDCTMGTKIKRDVTGPLGEKITAIYGLSGDGKTAIIEMASASGIHLVPKERRNPLWTTTYGTGEMIRDALDRGVSRILIGIGGSVTNDGGAGMLQALGVSFKDQAGKELPYGGGALSALHEIDVSGLDARLHSVTIEVACDVSNPLTGPQGASAVFGPQKGATPQMVAMLDSNLTHYAQVIKEQIGPDIAGVPGTGAAGGLGAGLLAFTNAVLKRGIDLVVEYTNLEQKMVEANVVFTGEGSIDKQTLYGKTPYGVASVAKKQGIPVVAFAGRIGDGAEQLYDYGFTSIIGIVKEWAPFDKVLADGSKNLENSVRNLCRFMRSQQPEKQAK